MDKLVDSEGAYIVNVDSSDVDSEAAGIEIKTDSRLSLPRKNSMNEGAGKLNLWQQSLTKPNNSQMEGVASELTDEEEQEQSDDAVSALLSVREGSADGKSPIFGKSSTQGENGRETFTKSDQNQEDEDENIAASLLAKSLRRTDSAIESINDDEGQLESSSSKPGQDVVKLKGLWNSKTWQGEWFSPLMPNVHATFMYTPDMTQAIDEEMEDQPCSICKETSAVNFYFCDLCNLGFHASCAEQLTLPEEDEDWHCKNCVKVLARYGNSLPPSRSWQGFFDMKDAQNKVKSIKETFKLSFTYTVIDDDAELSSETVQVGSFTGKGLNKFGGFIINGTLRKTGKDYVMECDKTYVRPPQKKRPSRSRSELLTRPKISTAPREPSERRLGVSPPNKRSRDTPSPVQLGSGPASANLSLQPSNKKSKKREQKYQSIIRDLTMKVSKLEAQLEKRNRGNLTLVSTDADCFFPVSENVINSARFMSAWALLAQSENVKERLTWFSEAPRGPLEIIFEAHTMAYVSELFDKAVQAEDDHLDLSGAIKAAGAVCSALDNLMKPHNPLRSDTNFRNGICVLRPPGHRTGRFGPMIEANSLGKQVLDFSLLNHVAIGAIYAHRKLGERVAVIDLSALGGVGTEQILAHYAAGRKVGESMLFYGSVECSSFASSRQYPSKDPEDSVLLRSNTSVHRLDEGCDAVEWTRACERLFSDLLVFGPTVTILTIGFEGMQNDPVAGSKLNLQADDFRWATEKLNQCGGKLLSVLEGGYNLASFRKGYKAHIESMVGL